jgi:hypothetical protein
MCVYDCMTPQTDSLFIMFAVYLASPGGAEPKGALIKLPLAHHRISTTSCTDASRVALVVQKMSC